MALHTFKNEEDGVSGVIFCHDRGFSVTLRDDDAEEYLGFWKIIPDLGDAIKHAKKIAGLK